MMNWQYVEKRFSLLVDDLQLTTLQKSDGYTKARNIGRILQKEYWNSEDGEPPIFLVGSWGKGTQVRPPRDLDMFFVLPWADKERFDKRTGNKQSQLIQEVKSVLEPSYPQTQMRGDGQVIVIAFNSIMVEVVPVFYMNSGQFIMPDANDGGVWKTVDPMAQINALDTADKAMKGNVRALSQIMKLWKHEKNVPLKSFIIELLVAEFLPQRGMGDQSTFWYDFYVRDFLRFLIQKESSFVVIPGTYEIYWLGNDWLSRAQTAYSYAMKACEYEYDNYQILAGEEWQKMLGTRIKTCW